MDTDLFPSSGANVPATPINNMTPSPGSFAEKVSGVASKFYQGAKDYVTNADSKPITPKVNPAASAPTVVHDMGSYKSLADAQIHGYGKDKKFNDAIAARQLKDPTKAPTPSLQMQAVSGKVLRVQQSPEYQSLRPENRLKIMGMMYDSYVQPALMKNGIEPPPKENWLAGYGAEPSAKKEDAGLYKTALDAYAASTGDMARLVGNTLKYTVGSGTLPGFKQSSRNSALSHYIDNKIKSVFEVADNLKNIDDTYNSSFESAHGVSGWLANTGGHLLGDAPAYMVAGEVSGALKVGEAVGAVTKAVVPSMAEKAALSGGAKVILHNLQTAGEVFGVEKGEGHSTKQAAQDAAAAAILGSVLHGSVKSLTANGSKIADTMIDSLRWAQAKLGAGGEPFSTKMAAEADKLDGLGEHHVPEEMPRALVNEHDPDTIASIQAEYRMREVIAREFHPEKAEKFGEDSVWKNLSKGQRSRIKEHIDSLNKVGAELMPLTSPELQVQANSMELTREAQANPEFAQALQAMEKLTGLKGAEILTKSQGEKVATKIGLLEPTKLLEESVKPETDNPFTHGHEVIEDYEPKNNESASLGPDYKVSYMANPNKQLSIAKLTNPLLGTEAFIHGTQRYLEDAPTDSGKIYFEHPEHQLLQVAVNSKAPLSVKTRAFNLLRKDFNVPKSEAEKRAGWLEFHVQKLRETGHLSSEGNVFRSTKLTPARYGTKWQRALTPELTATDNQITDSVLKKVDPKVAAVTRALTKNLNQLADRANLSKTATHRRNISRYIRDTVKEYK